MVRNTQTYSREDALDVRSYLELFLGALTIENTTRRIRTVLVVLLAGRLGFRANEIQHLHEGWIDWERGTIRIPAHEPCFCKWCLEAARGKVATREEIPESELALDDDRVLEYVYKHQYEPKPNASARVVPFGWSKRLTAWLHLYFVQKGNDYIDVTQQQLRDDVRLAASHANGVDPSGLTPHPLRATGATFFADAGFAPKPHRDLMGWSDRTESRRYVRASGRRLTVLTYEIFGRGDWAPEIVPEDPGAWWPVACNPRPFAAEVDVDPRDYGPEKRRERAKERADDPERLYNPRRERRPASVPYDADRHDLPGHVDPEGRSIDRVGAERVGDNADLREWIGHDVEQEEFVDDQPNRRGNSLDDFSSDDAAVTGPATAGKLAYYACVVFLSWSATFGPLG